MAELIIVGAGGLGREVLQYANDAAAAGRCPGVKGFLDDDPKSLDGFELGVGVIGPTNDAQLLSGEVVVAVGDPGVRRQFRLAVARAGGRLVSVIHPSAWVAPSATLRDGCVLAPAAFVGVGAYVAENALINVLASVGHDCTIGTDTVLAPHAALSGNCEVGDEVLLGTHSTAMPGIKVGSRSRVAVGACVNADLPQGSLAAGNPAKSRVMYV